MKLLCERTLPIARRARHHSVVRPMPSRRPVSYTHLDVYKRQDLDVVDVQAVAITATPEGETMVSLEMAGGQIMNLIFSPATLAQLEAMLAMANEALSLIHI